MSSEDKIKKMEALISLVDEPDPTTFRDISLSILGYGTSIIPYLEHAWESQPQPDIQKRLEVLIHEIQFKKVREDLKDWLDEGARDLLRGCIIVARYQFPELREDEIEYELGKIRKDIWIELNENLTALEQIKVFNYVFYDMHGFQGNIADYHDPHNSFINKVLEKKTGNPLSLGIIYMLVAQSLDIPVRGINLPEHFILAYTGSTLDPDTLEFKDNNVLFYINAFSRGVVFSYKDIETFLKQLKQEERPEFFNPCSNKEIIRRMLNNLMHTYDKRKDIVKLDEIKQLSLLLKKDEQD